MKAQNFIIFIFAKNFILQRKQKNLFLNFTRYKMSALRLNENLPRLQIFPQKKYIIRLESSAAVKRINRKLSLVSDKKNFIKVPAQFFVMFAEIFYKRLFFRRAKIIFVRKPICIRQIQFKFRVNFLRLTKPALGYRITINRFVEKNFADVCGEKIFRAFVFF